MSQALGSPIPSMTLLGEEELSLEGVSWRI